MAPQRRVGKESSQTRDQILDAVEACMTRSGYASATYRAVASQAGVAPSLIQYYFPTLDDLLVSAVRRRSEQSFQCLVELLRTRPDRPLRVLWEFSKDETDAALTVELSALGNHRESVRTEIVDHTRRLRAAQLAALAGTTQLGGMSPSAVLFLLSGIPKLIKMERGVDVDVGHAETTALVECLIEQHEPT